MCVSAAQIVYAFIMMPSTLPRSYVRFISKHGAKEAWVWKAVQVCGAGAGGDVCSRHGAQKVWVWKAVQACGKPAASVGSQRKAVCMRVGGFE